MDLSNVNAAGLRGCHAVFLGKLQTRWTAKRFPIQKQQGHPKDRKVDSSHNPTDAVGGVSDLPTLAFSTSPEIPPT